MRLSRRLRPADRMLLVYAAVALLVFVVLSLAGISQSSIGIAALQEDGLTSDGVVLGEPRPIRGDEFSRMTPDLLGALVDGATGHLTPLGQDPTVNIAIPNAGVVERIVFADRTALIALPLPDEMRFAASWWLWLLLAALGLPLTLRLWGLPLGLNALATAGVILTPAVVWWSLLPVAPIALASLVAASIALAVRVPGDRRWRWAARVGLVVVGALALARLPFAYFPFALPIAAGIVVPTIWALLADSRTRRPALAVTAAVVVAGAVAAVGVVVENRAALDALSSTQYPGLRRSAGLMLGLGPVFGAPFLDVLQHDADLVGTNQSEISSGWTVAAVAAAVLAAHSYRLLPRRQYLAALGAVLAVGLSWVSITWPTGLGQSLPLLSLVPPQRMMAVLGVPAILALAVALRPYWEPAGPRPTGSARRWAAVAAPGSVTAPLAVFLVTASAGSALQLTVLPGLGTWRILATSTVVAALLIGLMARPTLVRHIAVVVAIGAMTSVVWQVSPVMVGLGDVRDSRAAALVRDAAATTGEGRWAGNSWELTALLTANGVPGLGGDQWTGPSDAWLVLDPEREYEEAWNRGASVVGFRWTQAREEPVILSPQADLIIVEVSPCSDRMRDLGVVGVLSTVPLTADCLGSGEQFRYSGGTRYLYRTN